MRSTRALIHCRLHVELPLLQPADQYTVHNVIYVLLWSNSAPIAPTTPTKIKLVKDSRGQKDCKRLSGIRTITRGYIYSTFGIKLDGIFAENLANQLDSNTIILPIEHWEETSVQKIAKVMQSIHSHHHANVHNSISNKLYKTSISFQRTIPNGELIQSYPFDDSKSSGPHRLAKRSLDLQSTFCICYSTFSVS